MRLRSLVGCASVIAFALPGCGGSDPGPGQTAIAYYAALANGDGKKVCSLAASALQRHLISEAAGAASTPAGKHVDCPTAVEHLTGGPHPGRKLEVKSTSVKGKYALVTLGAGGGDASAPVRLVRERGSWKMLEP